ncbi:MAG: DUF1080 domain-containing protein [Balneolaceae bacterium]|nr:DUF1080 domain-containing protein [Balneolaceae bacterium]
MSGDDWYSRQEEGSRVNIITKEKYQDFEFRAEYNMSEGGNSGIFHHVIEQPGLAIHWSGPELQLSDNEAFPRNPTLLSCLHHYMIWKPAVPQNTRPAGEMGCNKNHFQWPIYGILAKR